VVGVGVLLMTIGAGAGAGVLLMMIGAGAGAGATTMLLLFAGAEAATGTRRTSQLGGPLPFPGDAGGRVSCPSCLPRPSQGDSWITRFLPRMPLIVWTMTNAPFLLRPRAAFVTLIVVLLPRRRELQWDVFVGIN